MNTIYLKKLISKNHAIQLIANAAYSASTVKLSLLAMAALMVSACSSSSSSSGVIEEQPETFSIVTNEEASTMETLTINSNEYHPVAIFDSSSVSLAQSSDSFIVKDNVLYASDPALIGDGKVIFTMMNDLDFKNNGNSFVPELIVDTINISVKEVQGSESPGIKISPVGDLEVNLPKNMVTNNWTGNLNDDDIQKIKDFLTDKLEDIDLNESISTLLIEAIISDLQFADPETGSGGQQTYNITFSAAEAISLPYISLSLIAMDLISSKDSLTVGCKADTLAISDGSHELVKYNNKQQTLDLDLQSMISDNLNEKVNFTDTVSNLMSFEEGCENCAVIDIDDQCDPSSIFIHAKQDNVEFVMRMFDESGVVNLIIDPLRDVLGDAVVNEVSESFTDYLADGKYFIYSYDIKSDRADINLSNDGSGFKIGSGDFFYPLLTRLKNETGYENNISGNDVSHELSEGGFYINDKLQLSNIEYGEADLFMVELSDFLGITYPKLTVFKQGDNDIQNDKDTQDPSYTYGVSQAWSQGNLSQLNSIFSSADYSSKQGAISITTDLQDEIQAYDVSVYESIFNKDGVSIQGYDYDIDLYSTDENSFQETYANAFASAVYFFDNV